MARILVVGGAGMLGHKLCQELPKYGHDVVCTVRRESEGLRRAAPKARQVQGVDVLDGSSLEAAIRDVRPDFVVNAIGIVKQLDAASSRHLSAAVNAWLPHRLEQECRRQGARLIHVSTDCVFSGRKGSYTETDPSDAEDLYGKSKWLGETENSLTLRTSIIGRELKRPTHGLVEWFLAQEGKIIKGFARAIYTGFTTLELCRIMARVMELHPGLTGVYHVASNPISKLDLLQLIRAVWPLQIDIRRDETFVCDRSLLMIRFARDTGYQAPTWESMIRELRADPTPYSEIQS